MEFDFNDFIKKKPNGGSFTLESKDGNTCLKANEKNKYMLDSSGIEIYEGYNEWDQYIRCEKTGEEIFISEKEVKFGDETFPRDSVTLIPKKINMNHLSIREDKLFCLDFPFETIKFFASRNKIKN